MLSKKRGPDIVRGSKINITYNGKVLEVTTLSDVEYDPEDSPPSRVYVQFPGPGGGGDGLKLYA